MEKPNHTSHKEHKAAAPSPQHEHHEHTHPHTDTPEHQHPHEPTHDHKDGHDHTHAYPKHETKEVKTEAKAVKKEDKKPIIKKEEAQAKGLNLHVSKRQCMYISTFIKNKSIDNAMHDLSLVIKMKKAVPFKGEIPHKKGMMGGRYPVKAAALFITLLKGLKGNALVNGLDPDKTRITLAVSNWASRPLRREGKKAKRTNVTLTAREVVK